MRTNGVARRLKCTYTSKQHPQAVPAATGFDSRPRSVLENDTLTWQDAHPERTAALPPNVSAILLRG